MYDAQGHEIPGFGGYRYFGAAKDLPGVNNVYKRQVPIAPEKTSNQIRKMIDEEYFGDSETYDEQLLKEEAFEEESKRYGELAVWIQKNKKKIQQFFKGREPQMQELLEHIDDIEDFEVELEEEHLRTEMI